MKKQTQLQHVIGNDLFRAIYPVIKDIMKNYIKILHAIKNKILKDSNNIDINKRKFDEVKREIGDFLKQHNCAFFVKHCTIRTLDGRIKKRTYLRPQDFTEEFLVLRNYLNFTDDKNKENSKYVLQCQLFYSELQFVMLLQRVLQKRLNEITERDVHNFENIVFLNELGRKKCSYAELKEKNRRRLYDIENNIVSTERIKELSFTFDGTTKYFEADTKCTVCMEGFESGQELSRLPCNDFFHKHCAEQWFKLPEDERPMVEDGSSSSHSNSIALGRYNDIDPPYRPPPLNEDGFPSRPLQLERTSLLRRPSLRDRSPLIRRPTLRNRSPLLRRPQLHDRLQLRDISLSDRLPLRFRSPLRDRTPLLDQLIRSPQVDQLTSSPLQDQPQLSPSMDQDFPAMLQYDIEEDVPNIAKFQCPNCRYNCC